MKSNSAEKWADVTVVIGGECSMQFVLMIGALGKIGDNRLNGGR